MWREKLQIHYTIMTNSQKKTVDYLMNNEIKSMTIRECASGAGVGQPTVLRMLQKCGYQGWNDFKQDVWRAEGDDEADFRTSLTMDQWNAESKYKQKQNEVLQVLKTDIRLIIEMMSSLDMQELTILVNKVKKANIIDVYGTDNSANAANELAGRLLHLGLPSRNYSDLFFQKVSAGHLGKKDVVFAFSMSGETTAIVKVIASAKESGATTVALTSYRDSSLAKEADYVVLTPAKRQSEESKWISSRITQIAFVDAFCAELIASDRKQFEKQLSISTDGFREDVSKWVQ